MIKIHLNIFTLNLIAFALILPSSILASPKTNVTWTTEIWPKVSEENGVGAYFDLLEAIYPATKFELQHSILPYKRGLLFVKEGRADIFSLCESSDEFYRGKYPWAQESLGVLFDEKVVGDWHGIESLENKSVAVDKVIDSLPFIKALNTNFIRTDSKTKSLLLLEKRRASFFLDIYINILNEIEKNSHISKSDYTFVPLQVITCYPGFTRSPKGEKLKEVWDQGVERIYKSGELHAIYKKWNMEVPDTQFANGM